MGDLCQLVWFWAGLDLSRETTFIYLLALLFILLIGTSISTAIGFFRQRKANQRFIALQHEYEQLNLNMERIVLERTEKVAERNNLLESYVSLCTRELRAPLARILGLLYISRDSQLKKDEIETVYQNLLISTEEMDQVIHKMGKILDLKDDKPISYPKDIHSKIDQLVKKA